MLFSERLDGLLKERKITWKEVYTTLHIGKNQKKYYYRIITFLMLKFLA